MKKEAIFKRFSVLAFGNSNPEKIMWIARKNFKGSPTAFNGCKTVLECVRSNGLKVSKITSLDQLSYGMREKIEEVITSWKEPDFILVREGIVKCHYQ